MNGYDKKVEMMHSKILKVVAAMALGISALFMAAPNANAALSNCGSGVWCYWDSTSYNGTMWAYANSGNTGFITVQSYYNHSSSGRGVRWWSSTGQTGTYHGCVNAGVANPSVLKIAASHQFNPTAFGGCTF